MSLLTHALALKVSESSREPVVLVSSAEFVLKSSPVRRTLEQRLIDDLKFALRKTGFGNFRIEKAAGRIIIKGIENKSSAAIICSKVFGVAYASPATKVVGLFEDIAEVIVQAAGEVILPNQSFAIRCHRSSPSAISTRDVEINGGSKVLRAFHKINVRVNLKHPDVLIAVDLSGENAYVYSTKIPGPGGLPLSSQWKMLAVLDSGPLSLFAAYVMMRRGCLVQLLIPFSTLNGHLSLKRQLILARKLRSFVTRENYRAFVTEIDQLPYVHRQLVRIMSLDIARKRRFKGVVFADVTGPISPSASLHYKSKVLDSPIFQPLIGFDRDDLVELCRVFEIEWEEVESELSAGESTPDESSLTNSPSLTIEEVSL